MRKHVERVAMIHHHSKSWTKNRRGWKEKKNEGKGKEKAKTNEDTTFRGNMPPRKKRSV